MPNNKTILKIFLFPLPVIFLLVLLELNSPQIFNDYEYKRQCIEKKSDSVQILILGSSHSYYAIQTNILGNAFNFSLVSQDFYYDMNILRKYINSLNNLKLVILSISYFSYGYDLMDSEEFWRSVFYHSIFNIQKNKINIKDYFNSKNYSLLSIYGFNTAFNLYFRNRNNITGSNSNFVDENIINRSILDSNNYSSVSGKKRADFHTSLFKKENIEYNMGFLREMIDICKKKNINVLLLTTPVTKYYSDNIDKKYYDIMMDLTKKIAEKNKCYYINYFSDNRFYIKDFWDFDHLNYDGSQKFSRILKDTLQYMKLK